MNKIWLLAVFISFGVAAQSTDPAFSEMLVLSLKHDVPEKKVEEIFNGNFYFLDCREQKEFQVSHIPNAIFVGPSPSAELLNTLPTDRPWILYCSVGVRGEKATKIALSANKQSFNLVGGIFEWVNQSLPIVDQNGNITTNVHPYNRVWGVWLRSGNKTFE